MHLYKPQEDITNQEIALINGIFALAQAKMIRQAGSGKDDVSSLISSSEDDEGNEFVSITHPYVEYLPESAQRHFEPKMSEFTIIS